MGMNEGVYRVSKWIEFNRVYVSISSRCGSCAFSWKVIVSTKWPPLLHPVKICLRRFNNTARIYLFNSAADYLQGLGPKPIAFIPNTIIIKLEQLQQIDEEQLEFHNGLAVWQ